MSTSSTCARCGTWHPAGDCDAAAALTAFVRRLSEDAHAADAAETLALVRYRFTRLR